MGIFGQFYQFAGRRMSTLLLTASAGVFFLDLTLNKATDYYWETNNKGKLWKHIKPKLTEQ